MAKKFPTELLNDIDADNLKLFLKIMEWYAEESAEQNLVLNKISEELLCIKKVQEKQLDFFILNGENSFSSKLDVAFRKYKNKLLAWIGGITVSAIIVYLLSLTFQVGDK